MTIKARPEGWSETELGWVLTKWELIREGQQLADQSNRDWKRINAHIKRQIDVTNAQRIRSGREPMTDLMIAETLNSSLPLNDALATGNWHSRNAERHMADVNLFLKLKEMGIL